jgi:hypothetical protein
MLPPVKPNKFADFLRSLPEEERRRRTMMQLKEAEDEYKIFKEAFSKEWCSLCNKSIKTFSSNSPCMHWLLRPKGFKKKHFPLLYDSFNYFRISAYVRWVASIDGQFRNINDISEEHPGDKLIDFTAKYKHITWSFSCGQNDFQGHKGKRAGNNPHYHLQLTLNGKGFISYNDYHIPLHEEDLYTFDLILNNFDIVKHGFGAGSGMQSLFENEEILEAAVDDSEVTENESAFNMSTLILADEGHTISGDLIANAYKESKQTGKTMASILKNTTTDEKVNIRTIVTPGKGVPEPQQRKGRKKNN